MEQERKAFIDWHVREFSFDVSFNLDHGDIHANKLFKCFQAGYGQNRAPIIENLRKVKGPLNTEMWEAPDGQGGQFADPNVALKCWQARANLPTHGGDDAGVLYNTFRQAARKLNAASENGCDALVAMNDSMFSLLKLYREAQAQAIAQMQGEV